MLRISRSCKFEAVARSFVPPLGGIVGALLAVVPGCDRAKSDNRVVTSPSSTAEIVGTDTRVHPVGELGHARDFSMSVESSKDCPLELPFAPKRGDVKLGIEVSIQGTSDREVPVNAFYATLADARGDTYSATLAGCDPPLPAVRLTNGKSARGFVTFEIPKASEKLELRYAPLVIGPGVEELKFGVTR